MRRSNRKPKTDRQSSRRAVPKTREKVFADLARGNSEDPATAKNGGYLPRPVKKNPEQGRCTLRSHGRYAAWRRFRHSHQVWRQLVHPAPRRISPQDFRRSKPDLLASLRNRRGYTAAAKLAERAKTRLKETKDPQKVAQELAAEANMNRRTWLRKLLSSNLATTFPILAAASNLKQWSRR